MARGALLFNLMARRYSRQPIGDQAAYEKKLAITRKYLKPDSDVFEFGCGTGSTALLHAPFVRSIHGTDYASKMIEIANEKKTEGNVANASFTVSNIDTMEVPTSRYDAVLALNILHLLENLDADLTRVHTMLKPGGYLISSTPCLEKISGIFRVILPLLTLLQLMPRLQGFSERQLLEKMEHAGFSVVEQWSPESKIKVAFLVVQKVGK